MSAALIHPISRSVVHARAHLRKTGWSYRSAAEELGCSFTQLAHVLTGRRTSKSLLSRILSLPPR